VVVSFFAFVTVSGCPLVLQVIVVVWPAASVIVCGIPLAVQLP
jgi:hypothetical protein